MRIEIFLEYFVNDRREKIDGLIGGIDSKKKSEKRDRSMTSRQSEVLKSST